jgi:hypothetical protein
VTTEEPAPVPRTGRAWTLPAYALVLVLTLLLAAWSAFLVPLRVAGTLVPVSLLLAGVGTALLGRTGGRVLRDRRGAVPPGLLFLVLALTLGSRRAEGDLVIAGGEGSGLATVGLLYLLAGAIGATTGYLLAPAPVPRTRRSGAGPPPRVPGPGAVSSSPDEAGASPRGGSGR